jgi:hypothetical protein
MRFALAPLLAGLRKSDVSAHIELTDITDFSIGLLDDEPLTLTDAAAPPDGSFVFTAAAEDTRDSYADGVCLGDAVGIVNAEDVIVGMWKLSEKVKPEGIAARITREGLELLMVTDDDDAAVPAQLLTVTIADWQ